ncbi:hypothetical protein NEIRO03_1736 [Nematocida sp. AWRm78]|nr:hypothetical protein NEIRO02_1787 [Nematocida sp. AWRm79]KAI5184459.1 hypothetical protein NEIRO03_1736 [Nematocida sp. AWRm78]
MFIRQEFITGIIILCRIYCKVGKSSYEPLHNKYINSKGLKIRLGGSLSPLGVEFAEELGLMHSKRFFSSAVDIYYNLNAYSNSNDEMGLNFNRTFNNDDVYPLEILSKSYENPVYIRDYHRALVYLFPSSIGGLSIYRNHCNTFITFLLSEHVFKHRINILASLFLLAEGVDIPLKIEGTGLEQVLVLREILTGEEKFSLSMCAMCDIEHDDKTMKNSKVLQERAINVINFFINNKTTPDIREGGRYAEPKTYEEFKTGRFLNNARWLIQYYIFEYLDTKDSIIKLAKTVHSMLIESIKKKRSEKSKESNNEVPYLKQIIDKCFVKSNGDISKDWRMQALDVLHDKTPLEDIFPFMAKHTLPRYQCVPSYNRKENSFNSVELRNNYVETALLRFFFYLAYDPEKEEYTTEHMGEVSPDLKRFFTKYNKPSDTITREMYNEWSKVVADLDNENIIYFNEDRNELVSGIVNTLYVITEITGRFSKDEQILKEFSTFMKKNKSSADLVRNVELYAEELFTSLAAISRLSNETLSPMKVSISFINEDKNKPYLEIPAAQKMRSKIHSLNSQTEIDEGLNFIESLSIQHSYQEHQIYIKLHHKNHYMLTDCMYGRSYIPTDSNITSITNIIRCIEREPNAILTNYIIKHSLEQILFKKYTKNTNNAIHPENMDITNDDNRFYPVDKFFLYNKMKSEEKTQRLISHIRSCLLKSPLEETDAWARTISNMLGYSINIIELDVLFNNIFYTPMYIDGLYKNCSKKITIPQEILDKARVSCA